MVQSSSGISLDVLAAFADQPVKRHFVAGSELLHQGDVSDCMHIIVSGRVRVERNEPNIDGPILLGEYGPGEVMGEMGVVTGALRSATVLALEDTETLEFRVRRGRRGRTLPVSREKAALLLELVGHRLHMIRLTREAVQRRQAAAGQNEG